MINFLGLIRTRCHYVEPNVLLGDVLASHWYEYPKFTIVIIKIDEGSSYLIVHVMVIVHNFIFLIRNQCTMRIENQICFVDGKAP